MLYHSMISRFGLGTLPPARTGLVVPTVLPAHAPMKTCGDAACQWLGCGANTWVQTVGHALHDAAPSADRATGGPVARRGVRPPPPLMVGGWFVIQKDRSTDSGATIRANTFIS